MRRTATEAQSHSDDRIPRGYSGATRTGRTDAALKEKGWLLVGSPAIDTPRSLGKWVRRGLASADTAPKPRKRAVRRQPVR